MMADKDDGDDGFYDDLPDPEDVPDNVIKGVEWRVGPGWASCVV